MTTNDPKPPPQPDTKCSTCGLPIHTHETAVAHYSPRGVTVEHQACWQSRTFGGDK